MSLYNLKTDGDQWRITKFDNDLNVESSYLLSETECECPAGSRPSCRHRQMLPTMLSNDLANTTGFYDYDNDQVLIPVGEALETSLPATERANPQGPAEDEVVATQPSFVAGNPHPSLPRINRRI